MKHPLSPGAERTRGFPRDTSHGRVSARHGTSLAQARSHGRIRFRGQRRRRQAAGRAVMSAERWWREPTRGQRITFFAGWLGWVGGAFGFILVCLVLAAV